MIEMSWLNREQYVLLWKFSGHWTEAEFTHTFHRFQILTQSMDEPTTVVLDLNESIAPSNLMTIAKQAFSQVNDTVERIIVVGHIPTWKSLHSILQYMMQNLAIPFLFVDTLEDVKGYINDNSHFSSTS
ncbi:MAG: hypothetical protein AAFV93_05345 [Chloroflexota bacterium]